MIDWRDQRVVVTGGAGFLGSFVVEKLQELGTRYVFVPHSRNYDLQEREAVIQLYQQSQPDVVIHLAGVVGGIGANEVNPGKFFYDNLIMGVQLMHYAYLYGVTN